MGEIAPLILWPVMRTAGILTIRQENCKLGGRRATKMERKENHLFIFRLHACTPHLSGTDIPEVRSSQWTNWLHRNQMVRSRWTDGRTDSIWVRSCPMNRRTNQLDLSHILSDEPKDEPTRSESGRVRWTNGRTDSIWVRSCQIDRRTDGRTDSIWVRSYPMDRWVNYGVSKGDWERDSVMEELRPL